jgi:hypothetical protein
LSATPEEEPAPPELDEPPDEDELLDELLLDEPPEDELLELLEDEPPLDELLEDDELLVATAKLCAGTLMVPFVVLTVTASCMLCVLPLTGTLTGTFS